MYIPCLDVIVSDEKYQIYTIFQQVDHRISMIEIGRNISVLFRVSIRCVGKSGDSKCALLSALILVGFYENQEN